MTRALGTLQRVAIARCEREERRRLAANGVVLLREDERAAAELAERGAAARQAEAVAAFTGNPACPQAQLWRQVSQERLAVATGELVEAEDALALAQSDAAVARQAHGRRERQRDVIADHLARDRLKERLRREEAEDDERVHRSVFRWGTAS